MKKQPSSATTIIRQCLDRVIWATLKTLCKMLPGVNSRPTCQSNFAISTTTSSIHLMIDIYEKKSPPTVVERKIVFPFSTYTPTNLFYTCKPHTALSSSSSSPPSISCWNFSATCIPKERRLYWIKRRPHYHYHSIFVVHHIYIYTRMKEFLSDALLFLYVL